MNKLAISQNKKKLINIKSVEIYDKLTVKDFKINKTINNILENMLFDNNINTKEIKENFNEKLKVILNNETTKGSYLSKDCVISNMGFSMSDHNSLKTVSNAYLLNFLNSKLIGSKNKRNKRASKSSIIFNFIHNKNKKNNNKNELKKKYKNLNMKNNSDKINQIKKEIDIKLCKININ